MSESFNRVAVIEEILIYHRKIHRDGDLVCLCGHKYAYGKSIMLHRAELIDATLTSYENAG